MNEQQGHGADPEGRGQGGLATAFDLAAFRLSMIALACAQTKLNAEILVLDLQLCTQI